VSGVAAVLVTLIIMVFLIRRGWKLGLSVWTALPVMVFLSGLSLDGTGETLKNTAFSSVTHNLLLAILGIGLLGEILYLNGGIGKALVAMKNLVREPRFIVAASPAFIGLMPIPGGAYLSAPLVKDVGEEINLSRENMALANVFYRHLFYFFFPLYPALIFFLETTGVPLYYVIMFSVVPFLVAFMQSFRAIFKGVSSGLRAKEAEKKLDFHGFLRHLGGFIYNISPILVALLLPLLAGLPYYTGLALAVLLALLQRLTPGKRGEELLSRVKKLKSGVKVNILVAIAGILFFQEMVLYSGALDPLAVFLREFGFPVILIALVIPYLAGLATGNQTPALGLSLPLLIPLVPGGAEGWPLLSLAYLSSLMGYVVSPVHLCPILTVEYFKVPLHVVLYRLQYLSIGVMASSILVAWLLSWW